MFKPIALVLLAGLLAGACRAPTVCGPGGIADGEAAQGAADAPSDQQLCQSSCDETAPLACADHHTDCAQSCEAQLASGVCVAETRASIACGLAAGLSAFYCMDGTHTILMPGYCQAESDTLLSCARSTPASH